jgi:hypothetical protein
MINLCPLLKKHMLKQVMRSSTVIILLACITQVHAESSSPKLADRAFKASQLQHANLDGTTLWKASRTQNQASNKTDLTGWGITPELKAKWAKGISDGPHSCNAADTETINAYPGGNADDSWGKLISDCGHSALNMFFGVNQDTMRKCLASKVTMTDKCAKCYTTMAEYDFNNCKVQCLFNWCSAGCITCNRGSDVIGCIGFVDPQPIPCSGASQSLYVQTSSGVMSFFAMALIALFAGSGVVRALLRFHYSNAGASEERLLAIHT